MNWLKKLLGIDNKIKSNDMDLNTIEESSKISLEKLDLPNQVVQITENNFIDADNPENVMRYSHNLKILINQAKQEGKIDNFKLIRTDDTLPEDWKWRVLSRDTQLRESWNYFTEAIRDELIKIAIRGVSKTFIDIPLSDKEKQEGFSKIDKKVGLFLTPVGFRSTKHFTINTPLSHTGDYNHVNSGRNFTIIDDIDNFLNSEYGYSMAARDAYLNVAHEELSVSKNAVVLIADAKYKEIIKNPNVAAQLQERKVILFKGDEGLAINMLLSEMGALSFKQGIKYAEKDEETIQIMENSLKALCQEYNMEYEISHGGFGERGHFSDKLDSANDEERQTQEEISNYLKKSFPQYADEFPTSFVHSGYYVRDLALKIIKEQGLDNVIKVINEFNKSVLEDFLIRKQKYKEDRANMSIETRNTFKNTFVRIKNYFANHEFERFSFNDREQIKKQIQYFFHSNTVDEQLKAAQALNKLLNLNLDIVTKQKT